MLDPNALAGMIFTLLLAALVGGFILLYPLSRRLGLLLEEKIRSQKGSAAPNTEDVHGVREQLRSLESEVGRLSEQQVFFEQLLAKREADALASGGRPGG